MMTDHSSLEDLVRLFEEAELVAPPVPSGLAPKLRQQQRWVFTTRRIDPLAMYMHGPYVAEAVAEPVDDYIAISHAGHGVNSYAINYHLVHGPLAVFAQTAWGGVYQDRARSSAAVCEQLDKCDELLSAVEGSRDSLPSSPARLVVAESDFHGLGICSWLDEPVGSEEVAHQWLREHQGGTPPPPFAALEAAIEVVREAA